MRKTKREASIRRLTLELRRTAEIYLERDDPAWSNAAAKLISESVRLERLEMDLRKERMEADQLERLIAHDAEINSVRGPH